MLKLSRAHVGDEEKQALCRIIDEGYLGMGSEVKAFEDDLKNFIAPGDDALHVACVSTGTSALHLAVQALGLGKGDEVLVPTLTYVASFQAIAATGATPIATDVCPQTGCMCPKDAEKRITTRTKAIMPVHYASGYGDLDAIYALAKRHQLRVIEDAAHSFGGFYRHQRVGATGDVICFSFDGIKNITCGEGGAVVSRDKAVIDRVSDLRLLAVAKDTEKRYTNQRSFDLEVFEQGWRYHMSNLNAAVGRVQLLKIDTFANKRRDLFKRYCTHLNPIYVTPVMIDIDHAVPHPFIIFIHHDTTVSLDVTANKRNALMAYLADHQVQSGLHYKPNHLLSYFKQDNSAPFPIADNLWARMITLPLHCHMTDEDVQLVCDLVNNFMKN